MLDGVPFSSISSSENGFLIDPFTVDEIKDTVWSCEGSKSPGPDVFKLSYFKSCWEGVEGDIVSFLNEFMQMVCFQ